MLFRHLTVERIVLVVASLVGVGVLSLATWSVAFAGTADQPRIDADVGDRYRSIDGLEATRTTTIERSGTVTSRTVYEAKLRPGTGRKRLAVVDGTTARYDLRVSNGSVLWLYDRSERSATRIPLSGPRVESTQRDRIERLFARLNASSGTTADDRSRSVAPLPVVPHAGTAGVVDTTDTRLGVSYVGTATVDGRETYVVRVAPRNGSSNATYEQTLWVDTERFFPLKQRTAWTANGRRTVLTTTYTNVSFDPGLGAAAFTPDLPANATLHEPETPEMRTYRRVADLRADAGIQVPRPDLPPSYELTYATRTEGRVAGVGLRYVNRTSRVTVSKYNFTYPPAGGDERVTIDGRTAELTHGPTSSLSWSCDSYRYTVRGQGVPPDSLVEIGRSVGCPGR